MPKVTKPVFIPGTNLVFPSAAAAAKSLGVNAGNVYSVLSGRRKTAGGYSFGYLSNRTVYVPETGQTFSDIKSAARSVRVSPKKALKGLEGRSGSAISGFHFMYADASKITPTAAVPAVPKSNTNKNRKAKKQERIKEHRAKKQKQIPPPKTSTPYAERQRQQQREYAKSKRERKKSNLLAAKMSELKNLLEGINNQLEKYYATNMMGYSRAAQDVAEFQNYLGSTDDGLFDVSDENLFSIMEMGAEDVSIWMKQIKDEISSKDGLFWDLKKQVEEREIYALEFGVLPSQLDEFADLLPDLWDVLKLANTKQKKGSKMDGTWDSIRDAIQGTVTREALKDVIDNLRKFWGGDRSRRLHEILADLDQYRAAASPLAQDIDENNLPF